MENRKVIWTPNPGSQSLALQVPADIVCVHGGRGGGKSDTQLFRYRQTVHQGYGRHWRGLIVDRTYSALEDLINKTKKYFPLFNDGARFLESRGAYKWVWKDGAELLFRAVADEDDYSKLHGHEFCLHINELIDIEGKGLVEIKDVIVGDKILTPVGYKSITKVFPIQDKECNTVYVFDKQNNIIGHQIQSTDHKLLTSKIRGFQKAKNRQSVALMSDVVGDDWFPHPYKTHESVFTKFKFESGTIQVAPCGIKPTIDITVEDVNCYVSPVTRLISRNCFIGINEATKYPDTKVLDLLMSLNRTSFVPEENPLPDGTVLPPIPMCVFITTNPSGSGRLPFKQRFIDKSAPGEILKTEVEVFNPRTQEKEIITKTQVHIFSSCLENLQLDPSYIADLQSISDPIKRAQWYLGDWGSCDDTENMFADIWQPNVHVMKPFAIPESWKIYRSYDHGEAKPFSVGWHAISDGCDVELHDNRTISTVKGDIFRIAEWYGCEVGKRNTGLRMLATDIAKGIIEKEISLGIYGKVIPGAADNAIWTVENGNSIAASMMRPVRLDSGRTVSGVTWARSDKGSGSRVVGWSNMRKHLAGAIKPLSGVREYAGLFIFDTCHDFIKLVDTIPRDKNNPDDIDTKAEDHIFDEARYFILSTATGARSGKTVGLS